MNWTGHDVSVCPGAGKSSGSPVESQQVPRESSMAEPLLLPEYNFSNLLPHVV